MLSGSTWCAALLGDGIQAPFAFQFAATDVTALRRLVRMAVAVFLDDLAPLPNFFPFEFCGARGGLLVGVDVWQCLCAGRRAGGRRRILALAGRGGEFLAGLL